MLTRTMMLTIALSGVPGASSLVAMQAERQVEKPGPDVTGPRLIERSEVKYTDEARAAKIEGSVTLRVVIAAEGRIYEAKVTRGLDPGLDANAIETVRAWRFAPATKKGQPVPVSANIELNFRLL